ncbi:MAG TPA: hypothetical protein VM659_07435 [Dongiaceae bacterium]|nr:hypothetical protein [Dongiaceae bacterium]
MQAQSQDHSVIVYPDLAGGWYFAEIDGKAVYRFGPFDSRKIVKELIPVLFPELPVLEMADSPARGDDEALMILGHAQRMEKITEGQPGSAALV